MKSLGVCFYIVLVDKTRCGVNIKLEIQRDALEYKWVWQSRTKIE